MRMLLLPHLCVHPLCKRTDRFKRIEKQAKDEEIKQPQSPKMEIQAHYMYFASISVTCMQVIDMVGRMRSRINIHLKAPVNFLLPQREVKTFPPPAVAVKY